MKRLYNAARSLERALARAGRRYWVAWLDCTWSTRKSLIVCVHGVLVRSLGDSKDVTAVCHVP